MDHRIDRLYDLAREYRGQARDFGRMKGYEWAARDARKDASLLQTRARVLQAKIAGGVRT
jgi:hypothetical protein